MDLTSVLAPGGGGAISGGAVPEQAEGHTGEDQAMGTQVFRVSETG